MENIISVALELGTAFLFVLALWQAFNFSSYMLRNYSVDHIGGLAVRKGVSDYFVVMLSGVAALIIGIGIVFALYGLEYLNGLTGSWGGQFVLMLLIPAIAMISMILGILFGTVINRFRA